MRYAHSYTSLTPEELQARITSDGDDQPVIIDTLPAERFAKVHIPGALNACVFEIRFLEQVHLLCADSNTPLVLYGANSNSLDSRTAAQKLTMAGYANIAILDGGLERWKQCGYALQGADPEMTGAEEHRIADGEYAIIVDESLLGWTGRNSNTSHYGTVDISGGHLHVEGNSIQGSFLMDMESIANLNLAGSELQQVLVSHLKSDDFFLADGFPAARFSIRGGRFTREADVTRANCEIDGTLELRGIQNDLKFQAIVTRWQDGHLHLSSHFDLDRTLWGITYGSGSYYQHLGMHSVFDLITIDVRIVARLQE
ncbi:MAG: rhodanese-like domain-containing protein [Desulfopila sp.]